MVHPRPDGGLMPEDVYNSCFNFSIPFRHKLCFVRYHCTLFSCQEDKTQSIFGNTRNMMTLMLMMLFVAISMVSTYGFINFSPLY